MRHRKVKGMTLDDLAERSGVGRRTLVQIESGKSNGSVKTWFALAETFDISIGEMLSPLYGPSRER